MSFWTLFSCFACASAAAATTTAITSTTRSHFVFVHGERERERGTEDFKEEADEQKRREKKND